MDRKNVYYNLTTTFCIQKTNLYNWTQKSDCSTAFLPSLCKYNSWQKKKMLLQKKELFIFIGYYIQTSTWSITIVYPKYKNNRFLQIDAIIYSNTCNNKKSYNISNILSEICQQEHKKHYMLKLFHLFLSSYLIARSKRHA